MNSVKSSQAKGKRQKAKGKRQKAKGKMKKNQIQFQFNTNYLKDNDCSLVIQRREFKIRPHTKTQTGTGRRGIANPQLASDNKDYVNVNITKGTA